MLGRIILLIVFVRTAHASSVATSISNQPDTDSNDHRSNHDNASSTTPSPIRKLALEQLRQLDFSFDWLEQNSHAVAHKECMPCTSNSAIRAASSSPDRINTRNLHRSLATFPKLRQDIKKIVQTRDTNDVDTLIASMVASSINNDTLFNYGYDATLGTVFETTFANPAVQVGVIALGLLILLPLAILEAFSIATLTPILCILGFENAILLGGSCSEYVAFDPKILNNTKFDKVARTTMFTIRSSLSRFFNTSTGEERIPSSSTDVSANLQDILEFGLSPSIEKYLNNVTIGTFLNEIATNNDTSPVVAASIIAITPLLMLLDVSERTNTTISCLLEDCNDKHQTRHLKQALSNEHHCEIQYMRCQMKKTLMIV
jgi:hypothetical protein